MANTLVNLARVQSTTIGTGTLTLGSAIAGFNTFSGAGLTDGQTVTYAIEDYSSDIPAAVTGREIGQGVYSAGTLTRGTVYSSTSGGAKINCSGRQHVLVTAAKEDFDTFLTTAAAAGAYQPLDSDLTTLAANITAFGHDLVDSADASAARTTLGLGTAAVQNTGTSGANIPFLNGTNTWSAAQVITGSVEFFTPMQMVSTFDSANVGPVFELYRSSATPAANDQCGILNFAANDSGGGKDNYGQIQLRISSATATSETGAIEINTKISGTLAQRLYIGGGLVITGATGGDTGAGTLNAVTLYENGTSLAAKYQGLDTELTAIAGLTSAADRLPYFTGSGTAALATFTTAGRNLVDDADASAQRTTLGLGTAATQNTGTSGNTVPLLDGANTYSGFSTYTANMLLQKASPVFQINGTSGDANGYISAASGNGATFRWGTWTGSAFSDRWLFGKDTTAESGANAGSDFVIYRYSDAGGFLATLMSASRADGSVNWRGGLYSNGVTGGSKGNGTLNFGTLYEGGTSLAAKYSALASANTFTAAQTVSVDSAATNTVTTVATLRSTSTGTPAAGIGVALDFAAETAAGNNEIGARIGVVTTDVTSTSEDFDIVFSAMAAGAAVAERARITSKGTYKHQSFTVAGLPAGTAGETCFASNGRKNGEGAGLGTGVLVFHDGTNWCACDTGAAVAA